MGTNIFESPTLRENVICGDFASVQLRGDWEQSIVRSIDGKMVEKFRIAYKLLRIEKVDFF